MCVLSSIEAIGHYLAGSVYDAEKYKKASSQITSTLRIL